jgi:hypothetical protein
MSVILSGKESNYVPSLGLSSPTANPHHLAFGAVHGSDRAQLCELMGLVISLGFGHDWA